MASNPIAMASNLIAMASNLIVMASNLIAMASNLIAMGSILKLKRKFDFQHLPTFTARLGKVLRGCGPNALAPRNVTGPVNSLFSQ